MQVFHSIELVPFPVPDRAYMKTTAGLKQDGIQPAPSFELSQLNIATLEKLCDEFRAAVFRKAGVTTKVEPSDIDHEPGGQWSLNRR